MLSPATVIFASYVLFPDSHTENCSNPVTVTHLAWRAGDLQCWQFRTDTPVLSGYAASPPEIPLQVFLEKENNMAEPRAVRYTDIVPAKKTVIGSKVVNAQKEDLGKIDDRVLDGC